MKSLRDVLRCGFAELDRRRKAAGYGKLRYSVKELAKKAGIDYKTVCSIKRGVYPSMYLDSAERLLIVFTRSFGWTVTFDGQDWRINEISVVNSTVSPFSNRPGTGARSTPTATAAGRHGDYDSVANQRSDDDHG